jgi:CheY-like chemotaxis protein
MASIPPPATVTEVMDLPASGMASDGERPYAGLKALSGRKRSMLKNFKCHLEHLWRQLEKVATSQRNVLAAPPAFSRRADFRVFAIEQRWQICFASTLERAVDIRQRQKIDVVIYDRDLPDADWRRALPRISNCAGPVIVIVLSYNTDVAAGRLVLDCGGFAVARKPVERCSLWRISTRCVDGLNLRGNKLSIK